MFGSHKIYSIATAMHPGLKGMPVVTQVLQIKWYIEMVIDLLVITVYPAF